MHKVIILSMLLVLTGKVFGSEVETTANGVVESAKCTVVTEESTTTETLVGGGAGAVAGGLLGGALGGKSGATWGGLLGAGAGALMGASSGEKIYQCRLLVNSEIGRHIVDTVSNTTYTKGAKVIVAKSKDGSYSLFD